MSYSRTLSSLMQKSSLRKLGRRFGPIRRLKWTFLQFYQLSTESRFFQLVLNFAFGLFLSFLFFSLTVYILDVQQLDAYSHLISYVLLFILTVSYIVSKYQRALFWLLFIYLIIYALPNLISFVMLVKLLELFLVTLVQNLAYLLSIISCSINLIWTNAVERANSRLRPVQEFMNSIQTIRTETNSRLDSLTKNESILSELYMEQNIENIIKLRTRLEQAELDFNTNFQQLIDYFNKLFEQKKAENSVDSLTRLEIDEKEDSIFNCFHILIETLYKCKEQTNELKLKCAEQLPVASFFVCRPISTEQICGVIIKKLKDDECLRVDQRGLNATKISSFMKNFELTKQILRFGKLKIVQNSKFDFNSSINQTERYSKATILLTSKVRTFFEDLQSFWKYLAIFFLSVSLYKSNKYLTNYLNDISYDNKLITNYFIHLDSRRRSESKRNILPLNPLNRSMACELFEFRRLPFEESDDLSYVTIFSIFVLTVLAFFINHIFIVILEEINRYFKVDFNYNSNFTFNVRINGTGFVAQKIRNIFKKFNNISTVQSTATSTRDCIQGVEYLDSNQLYFCFLLLFCYAFIKKTYHMICRFRSRFMSLIYPEMEKKRIIYLYNGMLNETIRMFKNSVLNLYSKLNSENEKIDHSFNDLLIEFRNFLLAHYSRKFVFKLPFINRDYCKVCEQREKQNDFSTKMHFCKRCYLTYCFKCFSYLNSKCLNCDLPNFGVNNLCKLENKTRFL